MYKECSTCHEEKLLSGFRKDKTQKCGRQPRCKVCARKAINANYKKYRKKTLQRNLERQQGTRQLLREYKEEQKCVACKEDEFVCLDFHHTNPSTKSFNLSAVTTQSWKTILEEIDKCVLVCKNCHAKIHGGLLDYRSLM